MSDDLKDEMIRWLKAQVDALQCEVRELRARLSGGPVMPAMSPTSLSENTRELTEMEYTVAERILGGMTTKQIMAEFDLQESTIKSHRYNIKKKLGTSDTEGLKACQALWRKPQP